MARYVVTGPHENVTAEQLKLVWATVLDLTDVDEFTTGGAWKVDTVAAMTAHIEFPSAHHRVVLPDEPHHPVWNAPPDGFEIVQTHGGYMSRNDVLVTYGDVLLAFPRTSREVNRSGTWATIRRARATGLEVRRFPLEDQ